MFAKAHMDDLKAAVREGRLIVVAGAGVSRSAGLPSWSDLLGKRMPAFLRDRGSKGRKTATQMLAIASDFPLEAAGLWWNWIESQEGLHQVSRFFEDTFLKATKPTPTHQRIVDLCRAAGPCVVTTNFDRLFELQAGDLLVHTPVDPSLGWALAPGRKTDTKYLFKLHGTAEKLDTVILTARQYGQQSARQGYQALFNAIQLNFAVLFVGYGGRDPDLDELRKQLIDQFKGNVNNSYMLVDRPDRALIEKLRANRVLVSEFNGRRDGYGIVDRLLDVLLEEAQASPTLPKKFLAKK